MELAKYIAIGAAIGVIITALVMWPAFIFPPTSTGRLIFTINSVIVLGAVGGGVFYYLDRK